MAVICGRCGWPVKHSRILGTLHICRTDCELAGRHLAVRIKRRWWRRAKLVCDACGAESLTGSA